MEEEYRITKDWNEVELLIAKGAATSVFGACIVHGPLGGVVMIQEKEKPQVRKEEGVLHDRGE